MPEPMNEAERTVMATLKAMARVDPAYRALFETLERPVTVTLPGKCCVPLKTLSVLARKRPT